MDASLMNYISLQVSLEVFQNLNHTPQMGTLRIFHVHYLFLRIGSLEQSNQIRRK